MRLALNVGMRTSIADGNPSDLSLSRICLELHAQHILPVSYSIQRSATEPTLVVVVSDKRPLGLESIRQRIHTAAIALQQDCIAVVPLQPSIEKGWAYVWSEGELIGPRAEAWGKFNREYFLLAEL